MKSFFVVEDGLLGDAIVNLNGKDVTVSIAGKPHYNLYYATINDDARLYDPDKPFKWVIIILKEVLNNPTLRRIDITDPKKGEYTCEY